MLVLGVICDDYEEFDLICSDASKFGSGLGLTIQAQDVREALVGLVESGLAKAYRLSPQPPEEIQGVPPADAEDIYFATDSGRLQIQSSHNRLLE